MEKEIITVVDDNGVEKEAEVVLCFKAGADKKDYVIYTLNEQDEQGMIILYSAMITREDGKINLNKLSPEDWNMAKSIMQNIAKEWEVIE